MAEYRCKNCGSLAGKVIFQFTECRYCAAVNTKEHDSLKEFLKWANYKEAVEAGVGEPVDCLRCQVCGGDFLYMV